MMSHHAGKIPDHLCNNTGGVSLTPVMGVGNDRAQSRNPLLFRQKMSSGQSHQFSFTPDPQIVPVPEGL